MTVPPMDAVEPPLWMAIEDVFHIKGRGTVVTGRLEGQGQLSIGDAMLCDDGRRWQVKGIEQFRRVLLTADPGSNIGILLSARPSADMLRGRRVWFQPANLAWADALFPADARKKKRWRG